MSESKEIIATWLNELVAEVAHDLHEQAKRVAHDLHEQAKRASVNGVPCPDGL